MAATDRSPQQPPAPPLACPKCGCELTLRRYQQLIDLGVDGVRDTCPVCGTLLLISFDEMTATETS